MLPNGKALVEDLSCTEDNSDERDATKKERDVLQKNKKKIKIGMWELRCYVKFGTKQHVLRLKVKGQGMGGGV